MNACDIYWNSILLILLCFSKSLNTAHYNSLNNWKIRWLIQQSGLRRVEDVKRTVNRFSCCINQVIEIGNFNPNRVKDEGKKGFREKNFCFQVGFASGALLFFLFFFLHFFHHHAFAMTFHFPVRLVHTAFFIHLCIAVVVKFNKHFTERLSKECKQDCYGNEILQILRQEMIAANVCRAGD